MTAICEAIEKLEKQIVKLRNRWRDTHRDVKSLRAQKESAGEEAAEEDSRACRRQKGRQSQSQRQRSGAEAPTSSVWLPMATPSP